jgi:hypothetical protein
MFTRACHWSLSSARYIQTTPSQPISLPSILFLFSHLHLHPPSGLIPSDFPTEILYSFSHACYMLHSPHLPWFDRPNNIWRSMLVMKLLIMQYSPASCHFLSIRSKYSPQHPIRNRARIAYSVYRLAMGWTIGLSGFDSRRGSGIILFDTISRQALEPTQPSIQWVLGTFSGGKPAGVWSWPLTSI